MLTPDERAAVEALRIDAATTEDAGGWPRQRAQDLRRLCDQLLSEDDPDKQVDAFSDLRARVSEFEERHPGVLFRKTVAPFLPPPEPRNTWRSLPFDGDSSDAAWRARATQAVASLQAVLGRDLAPDPSHEPSHGDGFSVRLKEPGPTGPAVARIRAIVGAVVIDGRLWTSAWVFHYLGSERVAPQSTPTVDHQFWELRPRADGPRWTFVTWSEGEGGPEEHAAFEAFGEAIEPAPGER